MPAVLDADNPQPWSRRSFIAAMGCSVLLISSKPAFALAKDSHRNFSIEGGAASTGWIDFDFFREAQIHVSGLLNGQPARLLIDSGVGSTAVQMDFAERLGLGTLGPIKVDDNFAISTGMKLKPITLNLGGLTITSARAISADMSAVHRLSGRSFDAAVGRDLFMQLMIDIDFPSRRIAAHRFGRYAPPAQARSLPLIPKGGVRLIPLAVEGRPPVQALFDLGSRAPLLLSPHYVQERKLLTGRRVSTEPSAGASGVSVATSVTLDRIHFGGVEMRNVPAVIPRIWADPNVQAVVGIGLLERFRILTDYSKDRIWLVPAADAVSRSFRKDRSGLHTSPLPDRLRIVHVSRGSPAEAAGWREGEEIIAIDGLAIDTAYLENGRPFWNGAAAGTVVVFKMADGSKRRLTLADYS